VVAILSGRKSLRAIARYGQDHPEVLQPLGFRPHKPYQPAHTTLQRMLEGLDITHLARVLGEELGEIGAIQTLVRGGKRLRGSQEDGARGLHLWTIPCWDGRCPYTRLEAFVAEGQRILGGVQVEGDEAAAVGLLLERLGLGELKGVVVVGDAAFADRRGCWQWPSWSLTPSFQPTPARPRPVGQRCVGARSGRTGCGPVGPCRTGWRFLG
jgi:hypothetical protein